MKKKTRTSRRRLQRNPGDAIGKFYSRSLEVANFLVDEFIETQNPLKAWEAIRYQLKTQRRLDSPPLVEYLLQVSEKILGIMHLTPDHVGDHFGDVLADALGVSRDHFNELEAEARDDAIYARVSEIFSEHFDDDNWTLKDCFRVAAAEFFAGNRNDQNDADMTKGDKAVEAAYYRKLKQLEPMRRWVNRMIEQARKEEKNVDRLSPGRN